MYDFNAMRNALANLSGYVKDGARGDAAFTRVLAEVAELTAEATEDAEAVDSLSLDVFLAGMAAADAQRTIDVQAAKIAEQAETIAKLEETLALSALLHAVDSLMIGLQQDLLNVKNSELLD